MLGWGRWGGLNSLDCWRCIQFSTDNWLFSFLIFSFLLLFYFILVLVLFCFVLFCCCCKQNQHKLKTIINMSGLSDLRGSGKVGGPGVGYVLEGELCLVPAKLHVCALCVRLFARKANKKRERARQTNSTKQRGTTTTRGARATTTRGTTVKMLTDKWAVKKARSRRNENKKCTRNEERKREVGRWEVRRVGVGGEWQWGTEEGESFTVPARGMCLPHRSLWGTLHVVVAACFSCCCSSSCCASSSVVVVSTQAAPLNRFSAACFTSLFPPSLYFFGSASLRSKTV